MIREITNPRIFAAYTDKEFYHDPALIIVLDNSSNNLLFLLGILNSNLATFYHFNSSPKATKGEFPKILVDDIKNFPLPNIPKLKSSIINSIENIVKKMITANSKIEKLQIIDNRLDLMVYKLYTLTYDECKIVDPEIEKLISREDYERMGIEQLSELR